MATESVEITADCEGKTLEELSRLIGKRAAALGETTRDAVVATAINIVSSLKAMTKKAPLRVNRKMYWVWKNSAVAGWERKGKKKFRRVVRTSADPHAHIDRVLTARCRNLVGKQYVPGEQVNVYTLQLFNENPKRTVYHCFAHNVKEVRKYAEKVIVLRMLKKESGMMKYSMGVSQAKLSTRWPALKRPSGSKQMKLAYQAARIATGGSGWAGYNNGILGNPTGWFQLDYHNDLRYSLNAIRGRKGALDVCIKKAANKTAGLIHLAFADKKFNQDVSTPFPEVQRKR